MRTLARTALFLAVVLGVHWVAYTVVPEPGLAVLPACETEDSTNCIWDADTQGNGEGRSFWDIDGTAYPLS